jgi:radical SAM protein (TIGR01212 family)
MELKYRSYREHLDSIYGEKTYKIVVSSGLTCPTRDGTRAKHGCAFCDVRGSSSFHAKKGRGADVVTQINQRIEPIRKRFNAQKFIAYFQSYTNTYSTDLDELRDLYTSAIEHPQISGLSIGTRPDCLSPEILALIESLAKIKPVCLELGVQSLENRTLEWLDRGHDAECSIHAIAQTRALAPSVELSVHLIFGNPTDLPTTPQRTAHLLSTLGVHGVKLHQLMVLENTKLAEWYRAEPFQTVSLTDYAEIVNQFLIHLDPKIYIERLYATATHPEECLAPHWSRERWGTHNKMRNYLAEKNCIQGSAIAGEPTSETTPQGMTLGEIAMSSVSEDCESTSA